MAEFPYNPIATQCPPSSCISQVAGYYDRNPAAQLSSCQSLFGFPAVPTVTLPAGEDAFTTVTSTYTDVVIVVTTSTAYSTAEEISTAYDTVYSTATEYTTTVTNTVFSTVTAAAAPSPARKKRDSNKLKRRGGCKPKTTTTTTATSEPLSEPTGHCSNIAEYSSACACIEPRTSTVFLTQTDTVQETVTVPGPASTQETVVTVGVTTMVVKPATTTLVSTLSTETVATATETSTVMPAPAIPTAFAITFGSDSVNAGKYLSIVGVPPAYTVSMANSAASSYKFALPASGGRMSLSDWPTHELYIRMSTNSYGLAFLTTASYTSTTAYTWQKATCSVTPETLEISCTAGSFKKFMQCGIYTYMSDGVLPGGCIWSSLVAVGI